MVFDMLANYVYLHTSMQTQDARLTAQRGRETQKAQTRLPPTALYMHSANALMQRNIKTMSWSEITCHAALNFMADPAPLELVPLFLGSMIENTFDWGFWLILGIFADFFETPALDVEEAERLFADPKYVVPDAAAKATRKWLASFGIGAIAANKVRGDTLFKVEQGDSVQQSTMYITSKWDEQTARVRPASQQALRWSPTTPWTGHYCSTRPWFRVCPSRFSSVQTKHVPSAPRRWSVPHYTHNTTVLFSVQRTPCRKHILWLLGAVDPQLG
jgi:hypothetical protein